MIKIGYHKGTDVFEGDVVELNFNRKPIRLIIKVLGALNNLPDGNKKHHYCVLIKSKKNKYYECTKCSFLGQKVTLKEIESYEYQRGFDLNKLNALKLISWVENKKFDIKKDANNIFYYIGKIIDFLLDLTDEFNDEWTVNKKLTNELWIQVGSYYKKLWALNKKVEPHTTAEWAKDSQNWQFELIDKRVKTKSGWWSWQWENGMKVIYLRK